MLALGLSLNVDEDEEQTFEASMMTAEEHLTALALPGRASITVHARAAQLPSTVSIKADITQPVGELRCAKCVHIGWPIAPARVGRRLLDRRP